MEKGIKEIKDRSKNLAILRAVEPEEIPDLLERRSDPKLVEGSVSTGRGPGQE